MLDNDFVMAKTVNGFKTKLERERAKKMGLFLNWCLLDLGAVTGFRSGCPPASIIGREKATQIEDVCSITHQGAPPKRQQSLNIQKFGYMVATFFRYACGQTDIRLERQTRSSQYWNSRWTGTRLTLRARLWVSDTFTFCFVSRGVRFSLLTVGSELSEYSASSSVLRPSLHRFSCSHRYTISRRNKTLSWKTQTTDFRHHPRCSGARGHSPAQGAVTELTTMQLLI